MSIHPHRETPGPQQAGRRIFRFAPSPNGLLHEGHAYSALLNQRMAAAAGDLLLRLEDIDRQRCTEEFRAAIGRDLHWLGVEWVRPVMRQSDRFGAYAEALDELRRRGLLYPCFCTRGEIVRAIGPGAAWPSDPDGSPLYPGTCRLLNDDERRQRFEAGLKAGWRLDMAAALIRLPARLDWSEWHDPDPVRRLEAVPQAWGDVLLARKDVLTSYHLAVVVDDAAQGVTHVVRGADLFQATAVHRLLQHLLGFPEPIYTHHRLVLGPDGRKLSKSRQSPSLQDMRRAGITATDVRARLGF